MRTYTDKDGVYVHVGDLAASLRNIAGPSEGTAEKRMLLAVADALEQVKLTALEHAVGELAQRRVWF